MREFIIGVEDVRIEEEVKGAQNQNEESKESVNLNQEEEKESEIELEVDQSCKSLIVHHT